MVKNETKHKIKNGVIVTLVLALGLAVVSSVFMFKNIKNVELKTMNFEIASVQEDGSVDSSGNSALVSDYVKAEGIEITVEENAKAGYKVHYYDTDKKYISSSDVLDEDYSLTAPEGTEYVRIEIIPIDDNYITIFEKNEYSNQINVTVAR